MKRTLLILILMLAGVSGRAQENEFRIPDSLMMKLKENEDGNAARAEVLCEVLDYCNKQYYIKNCYDYVIDLSEISNKIGSLFYKAVSDYYMGGYSCEFEKYTDAMMYFNRSLESVETLKNSFDKKELKAKLHLAKGYCLMSLHMYNDSYDQLQKGLDITDNDENLLRIHVGLLTNGGIYTNMQMTNEAEKCFLTVLENNSNLSTSNLIYSNTGMSNIMFQMEDYESSLKYVDVALSLAHDNHFLKDELSCLNNKVDILRIMKRYEEAFDVFDQFNVLMTA